MSRKTLSQQFVGGLAAAARWRVEIPEPPPERCVIIAAPHTTGWDLPIALLINWVGGLGLRWVGKEELFAGRAGPLLRRLGGIPVRRRTSTNFVAQMVAAFEGGGPMRLAIAPEGTRSKAGYWKTGFYYIAVGAGVPIALGYADYQNRVCGIGPVIQPTGDIEADFAAIRDFYAGIQGKYPDQQGPIRLAREADEPAPPPAE